MKIHYSMRSIIKTSVLMIMSVSSSFALPPGFVHLKYIDPTIIQDIRYDSNNNFVGKPLKGYRAATCILTRDAAFALARLQQSLSRYNLGIKVFDCYRPQQAVDQFVAWAADPQDQRNKNEYYPNVEKENLFRLDYISAHSGHTRGSTVDLTIVSFKKPHKPVELNMGTRFDFLDPSSHPDATTVSENAQHNRHQLQRMMEEAGFTPLRTEWWHFTLEDEPNKDVYYDFPVE